jgi:hypothetical protein
MNFPRRSHVPVRAAGADHSRLGGAVLVRRWTLAGLAAVGLILPMVAETAEAAKGSEAPPFSVGWSDDEFLGPMTGWLDARADLGAKGDGEHDDAAAIQAGLDALRRRDSHSGPVAIYFPAGTYRITRTLKMRQTLGASLVGASRDRSQLIWDGAAGGVMLQTTGAFDTRFLRLTWNGADRARIAVAQWWDYTHDRGSYQGSIKHVDEIFEHLDFGIFGGRLGKEYGQGDSETIVQRVIFRSIHVAAVNVGSFNALNWWIWDSRFEDCARGLSNEFSLDDAGPATGAGTFMVYRSVFLGSSVADIAIANTGWFSFSRNVSLGSQRFLRAAPLGAGGGGILLLGNTIADVRGPEAIVLGNQGPLLLLDNTFRVDPSPDRHVVRLDGLGAATDRDVVSLGNRYTLDPPFLYQRSSGRMLASGDQLVDPARISVMLPAPPVEAAARYRRIYEVAPGDGADRIQEAIDAAARDGTGNPVVHLPAGEFPIRHTLVIPPRVRLQLVGESETSRLVWSGTPAEGPILRLAGPSLATVRDVAFVGNRATAIELPGADQPFGRIFLEGSQFGAIECVGLARTRFDAQANPGIEGLQAQGCRSLLAVGGFGPLSLSAASRVLESDNWYEGDRADVVRAANAELTYLGGEIAPYSHGVGRGRDPLEPSILLDHFSGQANIIGATLGLPDARNGIRIGTVSPGSAVRFLGTTGTKDAYLDLPDQAQGIGATLSKVYDSNRGARALPDTGTTDAAFLEALFRPVRELVWESGPRPAPPPDVTDVRIFRVFTNLTALGLRATN